MQQTRQSVNRQSALAHAPAQVTALDPRPRDQAQSDRRYIRNLQISDMLSRYLELDQVIEAFMDEVLREVNYTGYRFSCEEREQPVEKGSLQGYNANYRLKMQNLLLGELTLFKGASFSSRELCELEDMLCALIHPVKNALMYQIALKSAYRDPLTGLNNRTSMEENLQREIDLAKRHNYPMALMVMDLDGFKQINDRCGHDVGDQVLREVAQAISHAVRSTDLIFRYGGDEFVGGLPQTDLAGVLNVSERIRKSIEDLDLGSCGTTGRVQISIGVTMVQVGDTFASTFKRADKGMYQAKAEGRNQIINC